jgi:excisionase family DNA binding protein
MVFLMALTAPHIDAVSPGSAPRVGLSRGDVMTAGEVSDLLAIPVSTVYYLARRGELPATRFGRTWRFLRPRIEAQLQG